MSKPPKKETKTEMKARLSKEDTKFKKRKRAAGKVLDKAGRVIPPDAYRDKPMNDFWHTVDPERMEEALKESNKPNALTLITYLRDPDKRITSMSLSLIHI